MDTPPKLERGLSRVIREKCRKKQGEWQKVEAVTDANAGSLTSTLRNEGFEATKRGKVVWARTKPVDTDTNQDCV